MAVETLQLQGESQSSGNQPPAPMHTQMHACTDSCPHTDACTHTGMHAYSCMHAHRWHTQRHARTNPGTSQLWWPTIMPASFPIMFDYTHTQESPGPTSLLLLSDQVLPLVYHSGLLNLLNIQILLQTISFIILWHRRRTFETQKKFYGAGNVDYKYMVTLFSYFKKYHGITDRRITSERAMIICI